MINENTIYYIDELTGEKKIYDGDWNKLQKKAKMEYDKRNTKIIKKDDGYLWVYEWLYISINKYVKNYKKNDYYFYTFILPY